MLSLLSNQSLIGRRENIKGIDYAIYPVVLMVEGVHHAVNGQPVYYSINAMVNSVPHWEGRPVPIKHPNVDGTYVRANDPVIEADWVVGRIYNAKVEDGKLKGEAWLEVAKTEKLSPGLIMGLDGGAQMEVSTGIMVEGDGIEGVWNSEMFTQSITQIIPDHLALLPGETGACSWKDGCGIRANTKKGGTSSQCRDPLGSPPGGQFSKCGKGGGGGIGGAKSSGGVSSASSGGGGAAAKSDSPDADAPKKGELSTAQSDALTTYSGSRYESINSGLRDGKLNAADKKTVASIDSAMERSTTSMELLGNPKLYRAASIPEIADAISSKKSLVGLEYTDKAFVSTTKSKDVASSFKSKDGHMLVISAPKGTKMVDMAKHSTFGEKEQEVLLGRGLKFKVTKVEPVKEKVQFRKLGGKMGTKTVTTNYIHVEVVSNLSANQAYEEDITLWDDLIDESHPYKLTSNINEINIRAQGESQMDQLLFAINQLNTLTEEDERLSLLSDMAFEFLDLKKAQVSFGEMESAVRAAVRSLSGPHIDGTPSPYYFYVREVYPDAVVYEKETPNGYQLFQRGYTRNADGSVTLLDDVIEVREQREFVPVNNQLQGENNMADKKPCCPEKVSAIIENEQTAFTEADHEFLTNLSEDQLEKIYITMSNAFKSKKQMDEEEAKKMAEEEAKKKAPKANTAAEYVASAPPEIAALLNAGLSQLEAKKSELVGTITANARNKFTPDQLKAMEVTQLEAIASLAAPIDFSVNGSGSGSSAPVAEEPYVHSINLFEKN